MMADAVNTLASSTLPFRDNHRQNQVLTMRITLIDTYKPVIIYLQVGPNQTPYNLVGPLFNVPRPRRQASLGAELQVD